MGKLSLGDNIEERLNFRPKKKTKIFLFFSYKKFKSRVKFVKEVKENLVWLYAVRQDGIRTAQAQFKKNVSSYFSEILADTEENLNLPINISIFEKLKIKAGIKISKFNAKANSEKFIQIPFVKNLEFSYKPAFICQGTGVFALTLVALFTVSFLTGPVLQLSRGNFMEASAVFKEKPLIAGSNASWSIFVKKQKITNNNYLLKLPKTAKNIKIEELTQAKAEQKIAAIQYSTNYHYVTNKQREELAEKEAEKDIFFASVINVAEKTIDRIKEKLNSGITETQDAKVVDLKKNRGLKADEEYVVVTFETLGAKIEEQETSNGKLVTISAPDDLLMTQVLAFANIQEIFTPAQLPLIKVKWKNNGEPASAQGYGEATEVPFTAYDLDDNGKLDYLEWTVPHLSEQVFEIILISKAFKLNENRTIQENIYGYVVSQDYFYKTISENQYVRVVFEQLLDNTKDITIYAKPTSKEFPIIEVYRENGLEAIAVFPEIYFEGKYKVYLNNLALPSDTFDLKIIKGSADIDYITDPALPANEAQDKNDVEQTFDVDQNI